MIPVVPKLQRIDFDTLTSTDCTVHNQTVVVASSLVGRCCIISMDHAPTHDPFITAPNYSESKINSDPQNINLDRRHKTPKMNSDSRL